jgi:hypothetical protein
MDFANASITLIDPYLNSIASMDSAITSIAPIHSAIASITSTDSANFSIASIDLELKIELKFSMEISGIFHGNFWLRNFHEQILAGKAEIFHGKFRNFPWKISAWTFAASSEISVTQHTCT